MAVQTGSTTTITRNIELDYVCSKCGTQNHVNSTISESVFSSALVRVNPYEEANRVFDYKIDNLNNGRIPDRYREFSPYCSCPNCRHVEPWAKVDKVAVNQWLFWIPLAVMLVVAVAAPIPAGLPKFLCILAGLIPGLVVLAVKLNRRGKIMKQIKALPEQSHPTARLLPQRRFF